MTEFPRVVVTSPVLDDGNLLQVVPTRLIQAVRNKLLRTYCRQLIVNNVLRADDIRLVGTTCRESVGLQEDNNLFQNCHNNWKQAVLTHLVDKQL
jgi:predicted PolB exonuclease-like 3'-5' exonuclease